MLAGYPDRHLCGGNCSGGGMSEVWALCLLPDAARTVPFTSTGCGCCQEQKRGIGPRSRTRPSYKRLALLQPQSMQSGLLRSWG